MLKYCLSTGKVTTDLIEYAKDLITVNLMLRKRSIPYWDGGSENLIESIRKSDVLNAISNTMKDISDYISLVESNITIIVNSVSLEGNLAHVKLSINGVNESYDIEG